MLQMQAKILFVELLCASSHKQCDLTQHISTHILACHADCSASGATCVGTPRGVCTAAKSNIVAVGGACIATAGKQ